MNFDTPRALAIDVGIWNFSYAIVRRDPTLEKPYVVEKWENVSLPAVAGFPGAHDRISANDINMTLLSNIAFCALESLFPPHWVRHSVDFVWIESQPRFRGKAGKVAELSSTLYNYFQAMLQPLQLCCWKFPDLQMVGAGTKFDGGIFFDLSADELVPPSVVDKGRSKGRRNREQYLKRKNYAEVLVSAMLSHPTCTLAFEDSQGFEKYRRCGKKDDYCDALLLAGVALRER